MRFFSLIASGWHASLAVVSLVLAAPARAAEEAAHGEGHAKVFPPFDTTTFGSTLFWLAILFGLLYWLMASKALPRIAAIKAARREQIDRDLASAAQMQKKAEEAEAAYTAAIAKSKAEAQASAQSARDAANAESEKRRTAVESDLASKLNAAEASIAATKAAAMGNVAAIATDAAAEIVRQITGKAPAPGDIKSAIAGALKG
jgi:F-type H+-transporting ATPase subunit b